MKTKERLTIADVLEELNVKLKEGIKREDLEKFLSQYPRVFRNPDNYINYLFSEGVVRTPYKSKNYTIYLAKA